MRTASSIILGITTALSLIVVSSAAADSFDAPKRLVTMMGIAIAVAAYCWSRAPLPAVRSRAHRIAAACAAAAFVLIAIAAFASPRRDVALDTLRTILVFASALALAAIDRAAFPAIANGFVAGAAVNAVVTLLQAIGRGPLQTVNAGDRFATFGLLGNTGVAGLVFAFAATIVIGKLLARRTAVNAALLVLLLAGLMVTRSATPILALAAGTMAAIAVARSTSRFMRFAVPIVGLAALALLIALLASRPTLQNGNALLSYRLGPWAAAVEMVRERPLTGWGPGTFGAEFAPHLIEGELRWQSRLMNPELTGSYAEAHNDYLQAAAEFGLPAAFLLTFAFGCVAWLLVRRTRDAITAGVLAAAVVAAITWFPLHRAPTALLLVAAAGHAWRIALDAREAR